MRFIHHNYKDFAFKASSPKTTSKNWERAASFSLQLGKHLGGVFCYLRNQIKPGSYMACLGMSTLWGLDESENGYLTDIFDLCRYFLNELVHAQTVFVTLVN